MLTSETKRHIDAARQVLVGVVPNPAEQINQITNALIYKFMDDMDQSAIKAGGQPSFFTGELERYAWTRLMDSRIGNQERMNLYSEALLKFSEAKQLPELFRGIFKSAFLPYRSPEVLGLFLQEISYFDYTHSEELGNAYEYLLSIMSSQGDAGQFRTPRHIIDFIVAVVSPTKDDKVLDPACGTAGFLISAYKHILAQHDGKSLDGSKNEEKPLTPDQRRALLSNFEGYDIDPGMVRIAQVNMYLHQFKNPKIFSYNTLADEERWNDKFDVILANPPFMSPKGGVSTHNKFSIESSRSEVLFVDYIMNHLRPRGRAGVIVPEGIIFQSGKGHTQLRKNLVNDGLWAVVSLPQGVFNPYAGVKTSVLLFDNELAKKNNEIVFVKITNDGFDLGATKRTINKNDLPDALAVLKVWRDGGKTESPIAVYVEKSLISESDDFNLSGDRYGKVTDYSKGKWPIVKLGDICEIERGASPRPIDAYVTEDFSGVNWVKIGDTKDADKYIWKTKEKITPEGAKKSRKVSIGDFVLSNSMSYGRPYIMKIDGYIHDGWLRLSEDSSRIGKDFMYYILKSSIVRDQFERVATGGVVKNLNSELVRKVEIPLPPLEVQQQIVEELDGYQKIISGARQIVDNWKPRIEVDPEWEKVKLGEVVDIFTGSTPKRTESSYWEDGSIPWFTIDDLREQGRIITSTQQKISKKGFEESSVKLLPKEAVLLCCTASVGEYAFAEIELTTNQQFNGLVINKDSKDKLIPKFLFWYSSTLKSELERMSGKATFNFVSAGTLKDFILPLPSLAIQKKIVEKIEVERALVEQNKKLIEIYEQKTKEVLAKLWKE